MSDIATRVKNIIVDNLKINIPDVRAQSQIASVLSAYDDLIEDNEKRIKILEEMAQLLYIEWFVKFKFPGHEKVKMVDSGNEYGTKRLGRIVRKQGRCRKQAEPGPVMAKRVWRKKTRPSCS